MEVNFWRFDWFSTDTLIGLFLCHVTIVRLQPRQIRNLDRANINANRSVIEKDNKFISIL